MDRQRVECWEITPDVCHITKGRFLTLHIFLLFFLSLGTTCDGVGPLVSMVVVVIRKTIKRGNYTTTLTVKWRHQKEGFCVMGSDLKTFCILFRVSLRTMFYRLVREGLTFPVVFVLLRFFDSVVFLGFPTLKFTSHHGTYSRTLSFSYNSFLSP